MQRALILRMHCWEHTKILLIDPVTGTRLQDIKPSRQRSYNDGQQYSFTHIRRSDRRNWINENLVNV